MKNFITLLSLIFCLTFSSCVTAQNVEPRPVYDEYVLNCVAYPVLYLENIPYYFYNNLWVRIDRPMWQHIHHYDKPRYHHFSGYPVRSHVDPPHRRPYFHGYYNGKYVDNRPNIHKPSRGIIGTPAERYNPRSQYNQSRSFPNQHNGHIGNPRGGRR